MSLCQPECAVLESVFAGAAAGPARSAGRNIILSGFRIRLSRFDLSYILYRVRDRVRSFLLVYPRSTRGVVRIVVFQ